ncbi:hypothetical protein MLD38_030542 [Melastoma candidum]|uniref:Uncharacterized protein n=1 Tax=Melastoma candidum TaxID=119954 RepID=A0ACB9MM14_9MYRT|nr:hypothetical protein MLD38_030542 [Melastoma candidum]
MSPPLWRAALPFPCAAIATLPLPLPLSRSRMDSILAANSRSAPRMVTTSGVGGGEGPECTRPAVSPEEWREWGSLSMKVPSMVAEIVEDLRVLEKSMDSPLCFGGIGGKLQGEFRVMEDRKHRAKYEALGDSEKKLQYFAARQVACRLLGSRNYLCQKCWLAMEDCMCSKITPCPLWQGMRFWLYMHPKDFLRQNNTGKLLWQVFGVNSATLCLFGVAEDEDVMWEAFRLAGRRRVWCLYPSKDSVGTSVQETFDPKQYIFQQDVEDGPLNFILIDGTWSNSAAMFRRLKEQAKSVWEGDDLLSISLSTGASAMHKLRPQPSWDRTCTAAAAVGLLSEMHHLPEFSSYNLDKNAEAVEDSLRVLLEALTNRRLRMGRSITRKARHRRDIC